MKSGQEKNRDNLVPERSMCFCIGVFGSRICGGNLRGFILLSLGVQRSIGSLANEAGILYKVQPDGWAADFWAHLWLGGIDGMSKQG